MNVLARAGLVAAMTASLGLGATATASAQSLHHEDAAGDVLKTTSDGTTSDSPETGNGDIRRVSLYHSLRRVGVRATYTDLAKTGDLRADVLEIRTNEGLYRTLVNFGQPGSWQGTAQLMKANGDTVRCSIARSVDFSTNVVKLSVPRSCVSYPRWVKLGFATVTGDATTAQYVDEALRTGFDTDSGDLTMSRRLYRG